MWTNDSFLVLKEVCELVANHSISALVFLHPGPSLEAVAATLAHLGLPLLVVDHHHLPLFFSCSLDCEMFAAGC